MKYRIAYIDEDKGWINTFYQTFKNDFDVTRIKVDSESSVESILDKLRESNLDAIVTDYLLEENDGASFNGNRIVEEIKKIRPHFPIIMLTSHPNQAINHTDDVHIIYSKDILSAENKKDQENLDILKIKINSNILNYYKKIDDTNTRIEELVKKRNKEGLGISEEEELTKLYILLDEINPEGKDLPANLIDRSSISKLNEFVSETKQILEELKKLNHKN
ncbi:response regulator [Bergeyella zoohelcum]|uniref:response regulator n=1 Tax=Bergeyella zoohelcum TaxID=1015 RepID=UPI002A90DB64|nr:response regulator [Bergeyella zoohelcum]MDY6026197.1 response regulator [Bergeyella zoohelcum]